MRKGNRLIQNLKPRGTFLPLIILALLIFCPVSVHSQGIQLSTGSGSGSGAALVTQSRVLDNAQSAYAASAEHLIESLPNTAGTQTRGEQIKAVAAEFKREFMEAARYRVEELKGDGILTADEVGDGLGSLREKYLHQLSEAILAAAKGYPVPPLPRDFNTTLGYTRALLDYSLTDRNSLQAWIYLAVAMVSGAIVAWLGNSGLSRVTTRLSNHGHVWQANVLNSLSGPVYLTAVVIGVYIGLSWIWIPGIAHSTLQKLMYVTLVTGVFWFLWNASRAVASGVAWIISKSYSHQINRHVIVVISRVLRVMFLMGYLLVMINVILDSDLTGLLAGLGVVGLALSFVLKGTIENIAASFTIFGDKPFRVGDLMLYKEQWGYVEDIGFRSTRFRTLDGHLINIPNSVLIEEALQNIEERPYIRRRFRISLTYETPPDKVREAIGILRDILENHRGQPEDKPPHVVFEGYGPYDLQLLIQYYYSPPDYWEALEFDTEVNLRILEQFNRADIDFAFPTQTNRLASEKDESIPMRIRNIGNQKGGDENSSGLDKGSAVE